MPSTKLPRQKKVENVLRKTGSKTSVTLQIQDAYHKHEADRLKLRPGGLDLADVIEWANWVPKDVRLREHLINENEPLTEATLTAAVEKLPQPLRSRLLKILHTPIDQGRIENPRLYRRSGTATFSSPEDEALMRRFLLLARYDDIRRFRESLELLLPLIRNEKIRYLRECPSCGQVFLAVRENQWYWPPSCAKEKRQKKWASEYKKKHGHSYRRRAAQSRTPPHLENVRRALKLWKKPPETREEKMELAAQADITLKQCQKALDYIDKEAGQDSAQR